MTRYRKRPVEVEAIQWNGKNLDEMKDFVGEALLYEIEDQAWKAGVNGASVNVMIHTLEGNHKASIGDYIIKGVRGEYYPCKQDIFDQTYESANKPYYEEIYEWAFMNMEGCDEPEFTLFDEICRAIAKYKNNVRKRDPSVCSVCGERLTEVSYAADTRGTSYSKVVTNGYGGRKALTTMVCPKCGLTYARRY